MRLADLSTRRRRGFTLLELLVAVALTSLLLTLLLSVISTLSKTSSRTAGRIEAGREARAIFEAMERDLNSSLPLPNSSWLQVIDDPNAPTSDPSPSQWLFFLCTPLDHGLADLGDVCVVSYRVAVPEFLGTTEPFIPSLHRLVIPADETFSGALAVEDLYVQFLEPRELIDPESETFASWFGAGVIDLQITPKTSAAGTRGVEVTLEILTKRGQILHDVLSDADLRKSEAFRFTRFIALPSPSA